MTETARSLVLKSLIRVFSGGYSNIVLSSSFERTPLSGEDKRFASTLYFGVLERRITLEALLSDFVKKKPPTDIYVILLIGLYQILYMDSVPDFAAVWGSVELCRNKKFKGFINACLRSVLRTGKESLLKRAEDTPTVKYSVSDWLYERTRNSLSEDADAFFELSFGAPPLYIRVNTLKTTPEELKEALQNRGITVENTIFPYSLKLSSVGDVTALEEYKKGLFYTTDQSSVAAVSALGIEKGQLLGDVCAAPGGKSFSAAMFGAEVYSYDIYPKKAELIKKGAERLGLNNITVSVVSADEFSGREDMFDRVICDVPCSGTGVIRRKPEIRYKNEDIGELIKKQRDIMNSAAKMVKKGGRMLYSTCSVLKEENEENVKLFLSENENFNLLNCEEFNGIIKRNSFGSLITPMDFMSDGFYFAVLERKV